MSRPSLALFVITCLFVGLLGSSWLRQPPSNQELLANYAKVADYVNATASLRGLPWWTPSYLQGCSSVFVSSVKLSRTSLFSRGWSRGRSTRRSETRPRFLPFLLCPLTMFAFVRRLCPVSGWTAFSCGAAYLFAPAILLRLGHVEHIANVLAFAMIPIAFLGVLVFLELRNAWSAVLCAVANAVLVLSYAKIAVLVFLLLLAVFALWVWATRAHFSPPPTRNILLCVGIFLILGALPNFPSLRETRFIANFDFGPFAEWQKNYSAESALSWMDRESRLTEARAPAQSEVRTNSSYLGIAGLACATALFFSETASVADFGGDGIPTIHGPDISCALARSRRQHGFVRPVRFSFARRFRLGSGSSDFLGLARFARGGHLDHHARVLAALGGLASPFSSIFAFRVST